MSDAPQSPELDYAYLAEFAKVDNNSLTAIGASYTHITTNRLPVRHMLYVAGRVRAAEKAPAFDLAIQFNGPRDTPELRVTLEAHPAMEARPYDGKVGITFALGMEVPLNYEGLYEVRLFIEEREVRRLAFDVQITADR